jgi:hypothetical protein
MAVFCSPTPLGESRRHSRKTATAAWLLAVFHRGPASWTALSAMRIERSSKKSVRNGKVFKGLHQFCGVLVPEKARWGPHGDHGNVI